MNDISMATIILCSHLDVDETVAPFEPKEWSTLAETLLAHKLTPADLLTLSKEELLRYFDIEKAVRIQALAGRSGSIAFTLNKYETMGIHIVTRADKDYPRQLKRVLGTSCPPLFYYAGDLNLCNQKGLGFVGSRTIEADDDQFTRTLANRAVTQGYCVISGGAKGVDTIATETALSSGGSAIEYLSDSLSKRLKKKSVIEGIRSGKLLLLSAAKPDAGFHAGLAMSRNKFIYAQSEATVVVRTDYQKGGTWSGATEALKKEYCPVLCWDNPNHQGNQALLRSGATPIDPTTTLNPLPQTQQPQQLTLF